MHEHEYYEMLMSRLLDEGLTAEEEQELREHLRACPRCAALFKVLSSMTVSLREDLAEPPAELAAGVMARIAAEEQPAAPQETAAPQPRTIPVRRPETKKAPRKRRGWMNLAIAACLVLVIGGGAFWYLRDSGRLSAGQEAAPEAASLMRAAGQAAPVAEVPESETETMEETDQPMTAAEDSALAVAAAGEDQAPVPSPSETPVPEPLPVRDVARQRVGTIAVDDIPAFAAMLEGGEVIGGAQGDWQFLFSVEYADREISFATDQEQDRLVWWDVNTPVTAAAGTFDQLQELIGMDPAALPE